MDLLKAEIGNNGWFFKSGQTIMSANGGRELNDEDVAKIKKLPVVGDVKAEVAYGNANSNNRWDGGNKKFIVPCIQANKDFHKIAQVSKGA